MSKLVAFAAIQGGYKVVSEVEGILERALQSQDASTKIGFPNTTYYLPVIYSLTGMKCETLEDLKKPLEFARGLLPPHVKGVNHLPFLGPLLDAGMAGLFAYEIKEAL
jgi:acetyl-CoA synthase